jgi:hypothetical protein
MATYATAKVVAQHASSRTNMIPLQPGYEGSAVERTLLGQSQREQYCTFSLVAGCAPKQKQHRCVIKTLIGRKKISICSTEYNDNFYLSS